MTAVKVIEFPFLLSSLFSLFSLTTSGLAREQSQDPRRRAQDIVGDILWTESEQ